MTLQKGSHHFPTSQREWDEWARQVPVVPDPNSVTTITVTDRAITDSKLRDSQPTSVIGRAGATLGAPADIVAATDQFLVRRGSALGFGFIADTDLPSTITRDSELVTAITAVTAAYVAAIAAAVSSGTYTPTLTNVTNLAASTAYVCTYLKAGNVITVSGRADIDPTATGAVELGISLPVASNFADTAQCCGTAFCNQVAGQGAAILSDPTNDRASLQFVTTDTANRAMYFVFQYQVI